MKNFKKLLPACLICFLSCQNLAFGKTITLKTTKKTTKKPKAKTLNLPEATPKNTDPQIYISEVMPSPNKNEPEWIEITNGSNKTINLQGWILDDKAGGSKPYVITSTTLKPNSVATFNNKQTKLSLANNGDEVRLFSPNLKIIDLITYDSAPKNQTLAKFKIQDLDTNTIHYERLWSSQISKNSPNPTLLSFTGKITDAFNSEKNSFNIDFQNEIYTVSTLNTSPNLATISFTKNTVAKLTVQPSELNNIKTNLLINYKIVSSPTVEQTQSINLFLILMIAIFVSLGFIFYSRWQKTSQPKPPL